MCTYLLQVSFIREDGDDSGGLTQEFFTLLPKEILNQYMEPTGVFRHNAGKLVYRMKMLVCDFALQVSHMSHHLSSLASELRHTM